VAERVDLDGQADPDALILQGDHAVEQNLPVAVAGEIVVGNEEPIDPLRPIFPDDLLEVVRRAEAALATLHVDDGAEGALVGAAAAKVDAGVFPRGAHDVLVGQDRRRLAFERGQMVHVVVERLELAVPRVAQHDVEPSLLRLACEERDSERLRLFQLRRQLGQHCEAPRDVEAADADRNPFGAELPGDVEGARVLVRLHPDDADQDLPAAALEIANDAGGKHAPIRFVVGLDGEVDAGTEHLALLRVLGEAVHAGERVGRQRRAIPLNGIAAVVVMGRLDQNKGKAGTALGRKRRGCVLTNDHPEPQRRTKQHASANTGNGGKQTFARAGPEPARYNGGTRPSLPTRMRAASIEPSSCLDPRATMAAPGLRSAFSPGAKATIGVLGSTTMTCRPPL